MVVYHVEDAKRKENIPGWIHSQTVQYMWVQPLSCCDIGFIGVLSLSIHSKTSSRHTSTWRSTEWCIHCI